MEMASIMVHLLKLSAYCLGVMYMAAFIRTRGPDNARCIVGHRANFRSGNPVPYNHLNYSDINASFVPRTQVLIMPGAYSDIKLFLDRENQFNHLYLFGH